MAKKAQPSRRNPDEAYAEAQRRIAEAAQTKANKLDLSRPGLTRLPPEIGQLTTLTWLALMHNQLSSLPPEIGHLTALVTLRLEGNQLPSLPPEIGHLTALTKLVLAGNQLSSLPPEIGQLTGLRVLYLERNQLSSLPREIGQLTALTELRLGDNQLSSLPPELQRLSHLEKLYLHSNPQLGLPPEVLGPTRLDVVQENATPARPADILAFYFRTHGVAAEATRPLNEAKVLLVGEAAVGKTSLVRALVASERCIPGRKMTEGIHIDRWEVPAKDAPETIRLNIWDFGGQEIMHATHQFFLTRRSLYLVVLDARQDEKQGRLEYWLRLTQSFGGDSPVIVVINKTDDGRLKLDRNGLMKKYEPNLRGFVETSCQSLAGIAELRDTIAREVRAMEHVDTRLPGSYFAVKEELEERAAAAPHIAYDAYQALCRERGVRTADDQERLARFLHDLGVVLSFRDDDRLAGLGVLSPQWVTAGVYRIVTSQDLNRSAGVLGRDLLEGILGPEAYPPEKRNFILEMMKKFELCFEFADATRGRWLIPGLLEKERPLLDWDDGEVARFEYRYAVLPGSVIWRFIVRNHTLLDREHPVYWRSGVVLHIDGAEALVIADEEDRRLSVAVRGPTCGQRRSALTHVRMELEHIHANLPRIEAKGKVPLPGCPDIAVEYQHLLRLEERGDERFLPEGAEHEYRVMDLLGGVASRTLRARDRRGTGRPDAGRAGEADDSVPIFICYSHKDALWLDRLKTVLAPLKSTLDLWDDTRIRPGELWLPWIEQALTQAKVGILLVSADFLASEFIRQKELPPLLDAANRDGLTIFWIPVRDSLYKHTAIEKYQAAWDPAKPLAGLAGAARDKALAQIAEKLAAACHVPRQ